MPAFLYPERTHDYDPGRDYRIDRKPDPQLAPIALAIREELTRALLPRLGVFAGFDVHFVTGLRGLLGLYVDGTVSRPAVLLRLKAIRAACARYGLPHELGIETTITHELAHALQESAGVPADEREAEEFARAWWERREAMPIGGASAPPRPDAT